MNSHPLTYSHKKLHRIHTAQQSILLLKKGIWLYLFLLVFEGALRKWILPSLSAPLLVIRDPIVIWLLIRSRQIGLIRWNLSIFIMTLIGIICVFTAVLFGHGNLPVALYGARILLIHFPMIFVIGRLFNSDDILKMGRVILAISIPMTILLVSQFYSPQSAWVNRGLGNDPEGAGFGGALGYFRPPTTFSFTVGTHLFYGLVTCFVIYFWLHLKQVRKLLLITSTACLLIAIPFSISRSLFYEVCITTFFGFIAVLHKPKYLQKAITGTVLVSLTFFFLASFSFLKPATNAFTARFESATEMEGGLKGTLGDRFLGGMAKYVAQNNDVPFWGYGIGIGTNVGSQFMTGKRDFLLAEEEWGRIIGEMGMFFGLIVILVRCKMAARLSIQSWKSLRNGNMLPWLLLSFAFILILQGQWAQPTILGFSVLAAGMTIASFRY